jgi:hypothetical protein
MTDTVLAKRFKIQGASVTQTKIYSFFFFVTFFAAFFTAFFAAFLAGGVALLLALFPATGAGMYFHEAGCFTPLLDHFAPAATQVFNHDSGEIPRSSSSTPYWYPQEGQIS